MDWSHCTNRPGADPPFCLGLYRRFSLRYSPTRSVDVAVHFLFLLDTFSKDFCLNEYIFKTLVLFLKVGVVGEESIDRFGRGFDIARLGHKTILDTEFVILFL